jgi:PAS domain S-box-containing protein
LDTASGATGFEHHYRSLFVNMPVGMYRHTSDGRLLDVNPALVNLLGYPDRETLLNVDARELAVDPDQQIPRFRRLVADGAISHYRMELRRYDGQAVWLEDNAWAERDDQGQVLYYEGLVIDVSDLIRAEAAERRQRLLAEALADAAAALNRSLDLDEVLDRILEQLALTIEHDSASVQRLAAGPGTGDQPADYLVLRAVHGFPDPAKLLGVRIPITNNFPNAAVVTSKKTLAIADVTRQYPHFREEADHYQAGHIVSWLGVPLIANDRVIGVITIDRAVLKPFTSQEIALAEAFAHHAAIALHNAQLYETMGAYSESLEQLVARRTADFQRAAEQVQAILANSPDAILLLDPDGTIELANPAAAELLGWALPELSGMAVTSLAAEGSAELLKALRVAARKGEKQRLELPAQRRDGHSFDAELALAPVWKESDLAGYVASLRDITIFKELERMKDDFVSNVSHELRTPISSLSLNYSLIQQNPERTERYLERIGRDIQRLTSLVEDFRQLARLEERPALEVAPVNLNLLAEQYAADRAVLATQYDLSLTCETWPGALIVNGNERLIGQLLSILLTNAFNYTPAGGRVVIGTVVRQRESGAWLGLRVADDGPGIRPEDQPFLFERFFRGETGRDARVSGTGLGLAIANEIVTHHGGTIEVESQGIPGQGATFTAWFPAMVIEG